MKMIFPFFASFLLSFYAISIQAQNCTNINQAIAMPTMMSMDGDMSDWTAYMSQLGNIVYDGTGGIDLDAPISDVGRDLVKFAFTEDAQNLYIYLERSGSTSNTVDIIFYVDVNNNDIMETREPVYHINWSGSNGNVSVNVKDYNENILNSLNVLSLNMDGSKLMGTLSYRSNSGPESSSGKGSSDGKSVEIKIPFTQITKQNSSGDVVDQLSFGEDFKFHVSTINGSIGSVPGANSINDNFGGCLNAPSHVLPVKLISFSAALNTNNRVQLSWATAEEINASHFVIEKSNDGQNFSDAGIVFAFGNSTFRNNYSYFDNLGTIKSGIVYYRLRSVDIDGKNQYSETRLIRLGNKDENKITFLSFPNPADNELNLTIPLHWQKKKVSYELFKMNGQIASRKETSYSSQTESINIKNLAPGLYIIRISCNGETAQQKIIKQ